jgi:rhodanese-related sulfurtransferase
MTVATLARQSPYQITQIILAGVSGALIAEFALYWYGLHYGQRFLGLLCRLSFSPDFCVRRTEEVFARVGSWSLLFAKFIPGLSLITVAMAGVTKMTDVRPKEIRAQEGTIPGAVSAHPADTDPALKSYPRETEIVVYCACPNEESAATAAKHLRQAGFKKIRPLLGGIDAWVQAGHPVDRAS